MKTLLRTYSLLTVFIAGFLFISFVHVSAAAAPPTVTNPVASSYKIVPIAYILPVTPTAGTVTVRFTPTSYVGSAKTMTMDNTLSVSINYDVTTNPVLLSHVNSADFSSLPEGTYDVRVQYTDLSASTASSTVNNVKVDLSTATPVLNSPSASTTYSSILNISYTLPENALSGSAKILFTNTVSSVTTILNLTDPVANADSFSLNINALSPNTHISSVINGVGNTIPAGTYNVTFAYQDFLGNPASTSLANGVILGAAATPTPVPTTTVAPTSVSVTITPTVTPTIAPALVATGSNVVLQILVGLMLIGFVLAVKKINTK